MKAQREKAQKNPPREEWDFAPCPDSELRACYWWEFCREIPSEWSDIAAKITQWRRKHRGNRFDDWVPQLQSLDPRVKPPPFSWELFVYCPEWPVQPYLAVPADERKRRHDLMPNLDTERDIENALQSGVPRIADARAGLDAQTEQGSRGRAGDDGVF